MGVTVFLSQVWHIFDWQFEKLCTCRKLLLKIIFKWIANVNIIDPIVRRGHLLPRYNPEMSPFSIVKYDTYLIDNLKSYEHVENYFWKFFLNELTNVNTFDLILRRGHLLPRCNWWVSPFSKVKYDTYLTDNLKSYVHVKNYFWKFFLNESTNVIFSILFCGMDIYCLNVIQGVTVF